MLESVCILIQLLQWVIRLILMSIITSLFQGWHPGLGNIFVRQGRSWSWFTPVWGCNGIYRKLIKCCCSTPTIKHPCIFLFFSSTRIDPWDIGQHLKVALKGPAESAKLFQEWLHELSPVIAHFWVGNGALPEARLTILHKIPPNEWQAIRKTILMYFSPPICGFFCPQSVFCLAMTSKQKFSCKMTTGK